MPTSRQVQFHSLAKDVAFTGAAGSGAVGTVPLFTVTGSVIIVAVVPRCTSSLVSGGGGEVSIGTSDAPALMWGGSGPAPFEDGMVWYGAPLADGVALGYVGNGAPWVVEDDDIIMTVGIADVTGGALSFTVFWASLGSGGSVS